MVVIEANIDSKVVLFIEETEVVYDYYLFIFTRGCQGFSNIYTSVECDFFTFLLNENIPEGIWTMQVYGQNDYSNLNPNNADFLYEDICRVTGNGNGNAYIITENDTYLIT
jgi:hypothetical protein